MYEDLQQTLKILKEKYPDYKLYGVGLSLGGNTLGNYIGEFKGYFGIQYMGDFKGVTESISKPLFDGAVLVCAPDKQLELHVHAHNHEKFIERTVVDAFSH